MVSEVTQKHLHRKTASYSAYLAVAKMYSYLGDHCTDRTSALWPGGKNMPFIHIYV